MEVWKDIYGSDGLYQISNLGRVRNVKKNWICRLEVTQRGYCRVDLHYDSKRHHKRVHRLVAEHFIPNPGNLPQVDHINGDRQDNRVENLRCASNITNSGNARASSSRKPVAIIAPDGSIRETFTSETKASKFLGVNRTSVSGVCNGYQNTTAGIKVKHL